MKVLISFSVTIHIDGLSRSYNEKFDYFIHEPVMIFWAAHGIQRRGVVHLQEMDKFQFN